MVGVAEPSPLVQGLSQIASDPNRVGELHAHIGEFCHDYRNRLHGLNLSLYLARRSLPRIGGTDWSRVEAIYRQTERIIDQLQWLCRPANVRPMRFTLGMLLEERRPVWSEWLEERGGRLEYAPGREVEGEFDPCRMTTALDALARWRAESSPPATTIHVSWSVDREHFALDWEESNAFRDDGAGAPGPVSLALPMVARAMSDHHGRMSLPRSRGFALALRWPLGSAPSECPSTELATAARP